MDDSLNWAVKSLNGTNELIPTDGNIYTKVSARLSVSNIVPKKHISFTFNMKSLQWKYFTKSELRYKEASWSIFFQILRFTCVFVWPLFKMYLAIFCCVLHSACLQICLIIIETFIECNLHDKWNKSTHSFLFHCIESLFRCSTIN